jgi:hypothetical protein
MRASTGEGDIDTLSKRLALSAPGPMSRSARAGSMMKAIGAGATRAVEDRLSDALHAR